MLKVAVTGGIGSGKSFVCQVFSILGIPIFNADKVAKELLHSNLAIKNQLQDWFGKDIYLSDGSIHRKNLAAIIFNDKIAIEKVNGIVHPLVREAFQIWAEKQSSPYVIQEAAILFESGQGRNFDRIVTVTAPLEDRIQRVSLRDGMDKKDVLARMNNQMLDEEKIKKSHYVIYADDDHLTIPQVFEIDYKLRRIWQNLENG